MYLSRICIKRPVLTIVFMLLLIIFGVISYYEIPLREYPNIDPPIVTISTSYPGASANVVENNITEVIENSVSGVEGIKNISSTSEDGRSRTTIEFNISENIDNAANDIRDRVSSIIDNLPSEAEHPEIEKASDDDNVIIWLNLTSVNMSVMELTDYAKKYLQDRFSVIDGVARVRIGGAKEKALRIWLDREAMLSYNIAPNDIEEILRKQNVDLPAGKIETQGKYFTVKVERLQKTIDDFKSLVLFKGESGYIVRLGDIAKIEIAPKEDKGFFRGNKVPMVGLGIIKQSNANTIAVSNAVQKEINNITKLLPEGMSIENSYDSSIFIKKAIMEVYKTLLIALLLVVILMFLFLGSVRAMIIPALTLPISIVSSFIGLYFLGYTINLLTALALVLAIGLIVDDAIVVLENIYRRIEDKEDSFIAAENGANQVGFAVIATTLVLIAVFVPVMFLSDYIGRLFSEFAATIIISISVSTFVALSLVPMLSARLLKSEKIEEASFTFKMNAFFNILKNKYRKSLSLLLSHVWLTFVILLISILGIYLLLQNAKTELVPKEDRGVIFFLVNGPEGASEEYMTEYMNEIEARLMPFVDSGEFKRLLVRVPRSFGSASSFNDGIGIIVLQDYGLRKPVWDYVNSIREITKDLTGVRVFPVVRQGLGRSFSKPVQFVLQGPDYKTISEWRDIIFKSLENNNQIVDLDSDYKETKPYIIVEIDKNSAGDLGVSVSNISKTLETMLGSRKVTNYIEDGEQYDVIVEELDRETRSPFDLSNIYVRSENTQELIPLQSLISEKESASSRKLNRYNKLRSITLEAGLADDMQLGKALDIFEEKVKELLPDGTLYDYQGESKSFKDAEQSIYFTFLLAILVVYLVMAGQFESFLNPFVIMFTVPFAVLGGLASLILFDQSLNIYSQIAMIMLVGIATKNGILIVEFINQLRQEGQDLIDAVLNASAIRLRPIIMTSTTTIVGTIPLVLSSGAGQEARMAIGITILGGLFCTMVFTLYIVPSIYFIMNRVKFLLEKEDS